jgi:HKD family nuclease
LNLGHFTGEVRYNYEDIKTFSAAGGYRFTHDGDIWFEIDPMAGFSAGNFDGIFGAVFGGIGYGRVALTVNGEYLHSLNSSNESDFFTWINFSYAYLTKFLCRNQCAAH